MILDFYEKSSILLAMRGKSEEAEQREERDKEIRRLRYAEGWTLERIGKEFGLSTQRIYQIVEKEE